MDQERGDGLDATALDATAMEWTERASRGISEHRPTGSDLERTAEVAKAYALLAVAQELRAIHADLSAIRGAVERLSPRGTKPAS